MISSSKKRKEKLLAVISFLILLISFKSSNAWSDLPIGNETFWWLIQFIFIFIILKIKTSYTSPVIGKKMFFVNIYLYWNIVCIIRGVFVAENYWEWKALLGTSFLLLLPLFVYIINSPLASQIILKIWFKYALFVFIPIFPFLWGDGVGKFLIPFSFLLLFISTLNFKWKVIVLLITVFVVVFDITARSNVIKFLLPLLIGHLFYIRKFLSIKILNSFRLLLLFVPFVLIFLAVSNIFNIFKMEEYVGEYNTKSKSSLRYDGSEEESLTTDTRTFLYVEVIQSALRNEYVFFGRTPARGNDSFTFGDYNKEVLNTGKQERFSNEVSILNIFTWLGIVGVLLYFLIFFKASYLAIKESNNFFIKLIGINVAFRWTYGWVEDFSLFDLSNIFLWLMIGMCFSESFRKMNDKEVKMWVKGIFEKQNTVSRKMIYNPMFKQH